MPITLDDKHNCTTCDHAVKVPQDLRLRKCQEGPPAPMLFPVGDGKVEMRYFYPIVGAGEVCDRWAPLPGKADA